MSVITATSNAISASHVLTRISGANASWSTANGTANVAYTLNGTPTTAAYSTATVQGPASLGTHILAAACRAYTGLDAPIAPAHAVFPNYSAARSTLETKLSTAMATALGSQAAQEALFKELVNAAGLAPTLADASGTYVLQYTSDLPSLSAILTMSQIPFALSSDASGNVNSRPLVLQDLPIVVQLVPAASL
jgi:hypothetical protein